MTSSADQHCRSALHRRLGAPLVVVVCLLYLLVAVGNALADNGLAAVGGAAGTGPAPPQAVDPQTQPVPAEGNGQQASTEQTADSEGAATQTQAGNTVISIRIDSAGDNGSITQTNVAVAVGAAANESTTMQRGAEAPAGEAQPGAQQSATEQAATSTATATQTQPINVIIVIRINSPGNDGPFSQTNAAVAVATADNGSATIQTGSTNGAAKPATSQDPLTTIGPPAEQQGAQTTSTRGSSDPEAVAGAPLSTAASNAPKTAVPGSHAVRHDAASGAAARPTAPNRSPARPQRLAPQLGRAGGIATRSPERQVGGAAAAHSAARAPSVTRTDGRGAAKAAAVRKAAAHPLRRFGSALPPLSPAQGQPDDVSGVVLSTLIALLGALLLWAGSTWLTGSRWPLPRGWRPWQ